MFIDLYRKDTHFVSFLQTFFENFLAVFLKRPQIWRFGTQFVISLNNTPIYIGAVFGRSWNVLFHVYFSHCRIVGVKHFGFGRLKIVPNLHKNKKNVLFNLKFLLILNKAMPIDEPPLFRIVINSVLKCP